MVTYNSLENISNSLNYSDTLQQAVYVPTINGNY